MKTSAIIRTVLLLSVLLFPMSCAGDDILFFDEELINENNNNPQPQTQTNTTETPSETSSETTTQIDEEIPQIETSGEDDEDNVANTTFAKTITISFSGASASVDGDADGFATVSGAHVTINNTGKENIIYKLTGSTTDGSFKLYSSKKQAILLSGVSITNPSGAAINNQSG